MKEMTSAEFTRANLSTLDEPVVIKRYTKVIGTYYPGEKPLEMTGIGPVLESAGLQPPKPSLDIAAMFRQIGQELRNIRMDVPCSDPLFHDHG